MKLCGLVLSGGRSERMGEDKGGLVYNHSGFDQRTRCYELLLTVCESVFISCRKEQAALFSNDIPRIFDEGKEEGPVRGILAAHRMHPEYSWLVLACDFPFADEKALQFLLQNRNEEKCATVFLHPDSGFLEPLFTIWEPKALQELTRCAARQEYSPRRALEAMDCEILKPLNLKSLVNINTPQEFAEILVSI